MIQQKENILSKWYIYLMLRFILPASFILSYFELKVGFSAVQYLSSIIRSLHSITEFEKWERQGSNSGLLGEKRELCLCALSQFEL